ncbi:MAG: PEP-CTERM sorting domain-containing protein [Planctomycetota bacterium]
MKTSMIAIALMSAAGAAVAQQHVVFATLQDQIFVHDGQASGAQTLLYTNPNGANDPDVNYGGLVRGPGETFWLHSAPRPIQDTANARILRLDNLFGGATETVLASNTPVQQPAGMLFDPTTRNLITINNPGSTANVNPRFEGVIGVNVDDGTVSTIFEENPNDPAPRYFAAAGITMAAGMNPNEYFITSVNGGAGGTPTPNGESSVIVKLTVDPNTLNGTVETVLDLTAANTGLASDLTFTRAIEKIDGTNDYLLSDAADNAIYRASFDAAGNYQGISLVRDGFASAGGLKYDNTDGTIVFYDPGADELYRISLDGSTIETLASNVEINSFVLIPAPGTAALLGLGGLVAARRRR